MILKNRIVINIIKKFINTNKEEHKHESIDSWEEKVMNFKVIVIVRVEQVFLLNIFVGVHKF